MLPHSRANSKRVRSSCEKVLKVLSVYDWVMWNASSKALDTHSKK